MKVLFVIDSLRQGGIRTSLLNLLANLDYEKNQYYLFCFHITLDDMNYIPEKIIVISPNKLFQIVGSTGNELKNKSFIKYLFRLMFSILCKIFNSNIVYKYIFKTENRKFDFDVAISYTNNVNDHSLYFGSNKFVIEKVNAPKKIGWIHADYEKMKLNTEINNNEYKYFDVIICVSPAVSSSFKKFNSDLSNKIKIIPNVLDMDKLNRLSKEKINDSINNNVLNIITVMRLDDNKDPLFLIDIAKELQNHGVVFCWRLLGDGPLFSKVKHKIYANHLEEKIILYGYVDNPYPYLKNSDLYVSTSNSEGYSLSIIEALYFDLDVISAKYDAIEEVLDNNNGTIINKSIKDYVYIIKNSLYLKKNHYIIHSNHEIINQINELFIH